jgi:hypothetical protein
MTEPTHQTASLADVAAEPPEVSVAKEADVLGDKPDTGPLVPEDSAQ